MKSTGGAERDLSQLKHDRQVLRERIAQHELGVLACRPFARRKKMILEDMLMDVEAEIRRRENQWKR